MKQATGGGYKLQPVTGGTYKLQPVTGGKESAVVTHMGRSTLAYKLSVVEGAK